MRAQATSRRHQNRVRPTPFLTALDSRAAIKGSRDPLGFQAIWVSFGRNVVGNLTTVSSSVRDFTITLLGYHFAEAVAAIDGPGTELATFLKWEQLANYARAHRNGARAFRGTERVQKALEEGTRVVLSADRAHQILSNQKIYGLWGLYSVPCRASGWLDGDPARLTAAGRTLVESYLQLLGKAGFRDAARIVELLRPDKVALDLNGSDARLVDAIAALLHPELRPDEVPLYREHLLYGGPQDETHGRQEQLATVLEKHLDDGAFTWTPALVRALAKQARERGTGWHPLGDHLDRIAACDSLLAPSSLLFSHLLGLDGWKLDEVADRLRKAWGKQLRTIDQPALEQLRLELGAHDAESGSRMVTLARTLAQGEYEAALETMVEQNAAVMKGRGGAPWVERENGRLQVRFKDEDGDLPDEKELPQLWRYPYFMDSLFMVARELRHG